MINEKEYIGFHKIKSIDDIVCESSINGSIFYDGYLGSGKLIKRAIEKYGPLNMRQELILVTEDKEEAEELEREIVCYEWVKSDKNYNLSIGGNITILFEEYNGFYEKSHTKETIDLIQKSRTDTFAKNPFSWSKSFLVDDNTITFLNNSEIKEYFGIEVDGWFEVNKLIYEGIIQYQSEYLQKAALHRYLKRHKFMNDHDARCAAKEKLAKLCRERFADIPKSAESNEKRSESIKAWINENPEKHREKMLKINKNPEKIRKTAEKHKGMKRSEDTKKNISEAKIGAPASNKGMIWIHNTKTKERKYVKRNSLISTGWARGMGKRK